MKTFILTCFLGVMVMAGSLSSAFAWGQNGHRITSEIAERNLSPKSLAVLRSILGEETLAEISTWPDDIRSDGTWDFVQPWHYISIEDDESWEGLERAEEGDLLLILEELETFLRDPAAKSLTLSSKVKGRSASSTLEIKQEKEIGKREALAFYVHFLGDLHQPLHVGRRDDKGGNRILVEWFDEELTLHRVWDEMIIESAQLSYTEFATFLNRVAKQNRNEWTKASYLEWAKESKELRAFVYDFGEQRGGYSLNVKEAPSLSYGYRHKVMPVVREQLAKGGIRLASKLDAIFADYPE
ncbi:MAG: S1/P1 nuclease [Verrucomicrobiae bacterium]|nr:S1/P1 nuclease [Verrucomicrobiae bacterium]